MVAREPFVLAGLPVVAAVFRQLSEAVSVVPGAEDGDHVGAGRVLLQVNGPAQAVLTAERAALNFIQRLSGVATFTSQFVEAVKGTRAKILDTRKTTPGLRR